MNFGKNSLKELYTCHVDLQKILSLAISRTNVDFGISEGYRSLERQKILFDDGKSTIDGISKKGMHNHKPSLAADLYVYHPDIEIREKIAYDKVHLAYIIGIVASCAVELLEDGEITHKIRWGGNWDMDGVLVIDQKFQDLPHVELV
jgi:peptidoglycan L-alanyl-D-glutamate endopeptidase CwlK